MIDSDSYRPLVQHMSGPAARQLARRLAAYLPVTLTRQILNQSLPPPGEARWLQAATLFADISGFTRIAEELAAEGPRGAEELNRALLLTFTALINAIHDAGGAVSHFHGDALMVYFDDMDGRAARRALACGRFMQSLLLTSFAQVRVKREAGKASVYGLSIKVGVGYGRCLKVIVGDPETSLEFVLAGAAVNEAVAAQRQAQAGQVVASRAVLHKANLPAVEAFRAVTEVAPVPRAQPSLYWEAFDQAALYRLLAAAPAFIPKVLYERLQNQNTQFVAEHRPVSSLFVRFEGIDYEAENAGVLLQTYYQWVCQVVGHFTARYGGGNGRVNRILMGDKGSQMHILFGAPVAPDVPEEAIRCALALQREKPAFITRQHIGLAAGKVFACAVGSQNRREYTAVGNVINLSARLAEVCPDGAVVVDEDTARRVADSIEFKRPLPASMKGRTEAMSLYQVVGERPVATPSPSSEWQEDTLYAFLLAQLDQLSAAGRSLLQVAAVIGAEFDLTTLVAVTPGMSAEMALNLLEAAAAAGIVQVAALEPAPTYLFVDASIHNVVYESLPYARRQALRAQVTQLLAR